MLIPEIAFTLKDGRKAVLRSPRDEDIPGMLECLYVTAGETEFILRYPEECGKYTPEGEKALFDSLNASPNDAMLLCLVFCFASACLALSRDVKKPRLDWVTEQEAVKQNFGVMISMLISWAVLALLALISYLMLNAGWTTLPVFAVLMAILLALAFAAYRVLMKNTDKYYCAG